MLNIFRGKATSPDYRLIPPPDGKLEVLTCHESVCQTTVEPQLARTENDPDIESQTLRIRSDITECQVHSSEIRVFHRSSRQAPPEPRAAEDTSRHWDP